MLGNPIEIRDINHAHLYCGLGGGAKGFNQARANVGNAHARFVCLGGIDVSQAAIRDFERLAGGGHYGVTSWGEPSAAVIGHAKHDRGPWCVADPRPADGEALPGLPAPADRLVAVIRALDGTWHRPFTTLELAVLQGLVDPEERLELDGLSDQAWRERIGNAVPPKAAKTIAVVMGQTLLLAWAGETFSMSSAPIWVAPVAAALAVETGEVVVS